MDLTNPDFQLELLETFAAICDKKFSCKTTISNDSLYYDGNWQLAVEFDDLKGTDGLGSPGRPLRFSYWPNTIQELVTGEGLYNNVRDNYIWLYKEFVPKELRKKK